MAKMISVAEGFQSSVNIAFDLNDESKLKKYIPTRSAMDLLKDILISTRTDSTNRSRVLVGPYGKGKSHIVLMILSVLMQKDWALFEKMRPVIERDDPELAELVENHYAHPDRKILPVIITGNNNSITQGFLLALQRTLEENEMNDIMPETGYIAAVRVIEMWKEKYPKTYEILKAVLDGNVEDFVNRLQDFDPAALTKFTEIHPKLTAGSEFNPLASFGVVELYETAAKNIRKRGYAGLYVVYDEFSKYLENHVSDSTKDDTTVLQGFAEKCNRNQGVELHLMLISHKEMLSYVGKSSKEVVDGWRGVSERFEHIYLNNNFAQTYDIIAAAIEKDPEKWEAFYKKHRDDFRSLEDRYREHPAFDDVMVDGEFGLAVQCYPLHPVSTYILPRLSERVAQNERTLFTYISKAGTATLNSRIEEENDDEFYLVTPDHIYDYFEPLLRQEVYSGSLHKVYLLTSAILRKLAEDSLEAKLIN